MLFVSIVGLILSNFARAQMDHSSHVSIAAPAKPASCIGSGLDCANAATPFITSDGKLLLAWTSGGKVSVAQSFDMGNTFSAPVIVGEHGKSLDVGSDASPKLLLTQMGMFSSHTLSLKTRNGMRKLIQCDLQMVAPHSLFLIR